MNLSSQMQKIAVDLETQLNGVADAQLSRSSESVLKEERMFSNIRKKIALHEAKNPGVFFGKNMHPKNIDELISNSLVLKLTPDDMQTLFSMRRTMDIEGMYVVLHGPIMEGLKKMTQNDIHIQQGAPLTYDLHQQYGLESMVIELASGNISPDKYRHSIEGMRAKLSQYQIS